MTDSDNDFEEQLRQEAAEQQRKADLEAGKIKVDPDGTVYDWDEEKKAWFPRVDEDFIARYQMSYGTTESKPSATESAQVPPAPAVDDPAYSEWYYKYAGRSEGSGGIPFDVNSEEYRNWYNYYYGKNNAESSDDKSEKVPIDSENIKNQNDNKKLHNETVPTNVTGEETGQEHQSQSDIEAYYAYYYQHYGQGEEQHTATGSNESNGKNPAKLDPAMAEYWNQYYEAHPREKPEEKAPEEESESVGKKGKKRKGPPQPKEPPKWFDVEESKNTNVYVAGLPDTITEETFVELMNKYGLIMFDPVTKKPKVKLYKDGSGKNKGDGLCCYIKSESVDLALQILDGSDYEGYKISVEKAKFELKGSYDPKKKKKLTNSQKRKMKENQEKLFDWRPDKMRGERGKHERVVIVKNLFDPADFEKNPILINEIRQDLREECKKFGEVRKIMIFDRHTDGLATIKFKEAEEADICIKSLDKRFFAGRRLISETWDGKSKFDIKETADQEADRLKQWENFLEDADSNKESGSGDNVSTVQEKERNSSTTT